jgi:hypothetical protein
MLPGTNNSFGNALTFRSFSGITAFSVVALEVEGAAGIARDSLVMEPSVEKRSKSQQLYREVGENKVYGIMKLSQLLWIKILL